MSGGYQVEIGAIRKAAHSAASAGEQAGKVDLASAVGPVGGALPGSRSSQAIGTLSSAWTTLVKHWSTDAQAYADGLSTAADNYTASDDAAQRALHHLPAAPTGPKPI
jgi:hypothetical protein